MKLRTIWVGFRTAYLFGISYPKLKRVQKNHDDETALKFMNDVCRKLIKSAKIDLEVVGRENIKIDENFVLVGNHESFFDLLFIMSQVYSIIGFVAKSSLGKIPVFSSWMRYYNCIFLDREDMRGQVESIRQAIDVVKNKNNVGVLPEGTRRTGRDKFKPGSFKIPIKAKAPIIPCTVINSHGAFEERTTNKTQKGKVIFHEPIYYEDYKDMKINDLAKYVEDIVYSVYDTEVK